MTVDRARDVATPPAPLGPYSPAIRCRAQCEFVFVSGQLPLDASGGPTGHDLGAQTRSALANALAVARREGAGPEDVVKITLYTTDISHMDALNEAYADVLGGARPARTTVEVSRLPRGALIEVDLIAAVAPTP